MGGEYKLITTRKDKEDYKENCSHILTFNGGVIDSPTSRSLNTTIEMIKLNCVKYLADSPEIERLETRIRIRK